MRDIHVQANKIKFKPEFASRKTATKIAIPSTKMIVFTFKAKLLPSHMHKRLCSKLSQTRKYVYAQVLYVRRSPLQV